MLSIQEDWRKTLTYPDPEKTSRKQWAWEFLRRRSDYAQDQKHVMELLGKNAVTLGLDDSGEITTSECFSELDDFDVGAIEEKCCQKYFVSNMYNPPALDFHSIKYNLAIGVGLERPRFLAYKENTVYVTKMRPLIDFQADQACALLPKPSRPGQLVVKIDVHLPLSFLKKQIETLLSEQQEAFKKDGGEVLDINYKPHSYLGHLQILDAEYSLRSDSDSDNSVLEKIAKQLFPNDQGDVTKRLLPRLKMARKYRDFYYAYLPLFSTPGETVETYQQTGES